MLCQVCGKNEATVEFTEIVNEEVKQLHLCDECAKEKGVEMEQHFGIADFLAGMSDLGVKSRGDDITIKCKKCSMSFEDFQKIGRFGCGDCYIAFRKNLIPLLKRIHGSTRHAGKTLSEAGRPDGRERSEIQELRRRLHEAVDAEEFEEAAKLRDKIRELEKKAREKG